MYESCHSDARYGVNTGFVPGVVLSEVELPPEFEKGETVTAVSRENTTEQFLFFEVSICLIER